MFSNALVCFPSALPRAPAKTYSFQGLNKCLVREGCQSPGGPVSPTLTPGDRQMCYLHGEPMRVYPL